jgi:hypothetical protein
LPVREVIDEMKTIGWDDFPMEIPKDVAVCPKCGKGLIFEDVYEWYDDGTIDNTGFSFTCSTEPAIDTDAWWGFHHSHWATPYVDWLPLTDTVCRWFNENYRHTIT